MRRINYESDFVATMRLPQGVSGVDFALEFRTGGMARYVVSRLKGECVNCCEIGDGVIAVVFKDHRLQPGTLAMKVTTWRVSQYCESGLKDVHPSVEDVELVQGQSDDNRDDISLDMLLSYSVQDVYGVAKLKGYDGSEDDFYARWIDVLNNGSSGGAVTGVKVADVTDGAGKSLADILKEMTAETSTKAPEMHTHSGYATTASVKELGAKVTDLGNAIGDGNSMVKIRFGEEIKRGSIERNGKTYEVWAKCVEIDGLNKEEGGLTTVVIDEDSLGRDLLLDVERFVVSASGEFISSRWVCDRIYVDAVDRNTKIEIRCSADMGDRVITNAWVEIVYVKDIVTYDELILDLPDVAWGNYTVEFPSLKFNKDMAVVWSQDDAMLDIYNKFFKYANGRWVDYGRNYHELTGVRGAGEQATRLLTYTDGCGNRRVYTFDSAFFSYTKNGSDEIHSGNYPYEYIDWRELNKFLDFGNSVSNHGGGDESAGHEWESLANNNARIAEKTGRVPMILAIPGGTDTNAFVEAAQKHDDIYYMRTKDAPLHSLDNLSYADFTLKKGIFGREFTDTMADKTFAGLKSVVDACAARTDHPLLYMASHGCYSPGDNKPAEFQWDAAKRMYDYIYDELNDRALCVGPTELFEWLYTRVHSRVAVVNDNGKMRVVMRLAQLPNFTAKDVSVVIRGVEAANVVVSGQNVTKMSVGSIEGGTLVNVCYAQHWIDMAEKYTAIWELNKTDDSKSDAEYFVSRLSEVLAQPFNERLNGCAVAPKITNIAINGNEASTTSRNVELRVKSNQPISKVRYGEVSDLSGVEWQGVAGVSYEVMANVELTPELGAKMLYAQVMNGDSLASVVASATIVLKESTPEVITYKVTAVANAGGVVNPASQDVASGDSATVVATADSGHVIESWTGADSSTGVGGGSGTATVLNVMSNKAISVNFQVAVPASTERILIFNKEVGTTYEQLANGDWYNWLYNTGFSGTADKDIVNVGKTKIGVRNYNGTTAFFDASAADQPTLVGNKCKYPDELLKYFISYRGNLVYPQGGEMVLKGIANGTYKVSILVSTSANSASVAKKGIYVINGVETRVPNDMDVVNNVTAWLVVEGVIVTDGVMKMVVCSESAWERVGFNALEIEKIE